MTTLSQPQSTFLSVNSLRLHYLDWGNPSAPPVVCVHGYTSSAQAFAAPARHFQGRLHVIAPDVRGHGESAWSAMEAYQCHDQISDLAGFVDQLGTESDVLSEAQARRMVDVLPQAELVAVPGVGHAPTLMEPVALAALERFLGAPEAVASRE